MTEGASPRDDVNDDPNVPEDGEGTDPAEAEPGAGTGSPAAAEGSDRTSGDDGTGEPSSDSFGNGPRVAALEQETDIAADYLEELLDIADLDGDLDLYVEGDRAMVSIVGDGLDDLVGRRGEVLDALQELTRLAIQRSTGERSRLMLDIGGFRAAKRKALEARTREVVAEVQESSQPKKLEPMSPFERKVVHDAVAAGGLKSESEGEEPNRCVVVLPA